MDPNLEREQTQVVVNSPGQRREIHRKNIAGTGEYGSHMVKGVRGVKSVDNRLVVSSVSNVGVLRLLSCRAAVVFSSGD